MRRSLRNNVGAEALIHIQFPPAVCVHRRTGRVLYIMAHASKDMVLPHDTFFPARLAAMYICVESKSTCLLTDSSLLFIYNYSPLDQKTRTSNTHPNQTHFSHIQSITDPTTNCRDDFLRGAEVR